MSGFLGPSGVAEPPSGAAGGDLSGTYPNPTIPGIDKTIAFVVNLVDGYSSTLLSTDGYVVSASIKILTPYSGGATLSIGQATSVSLFAATTDINAQGTANDIYEVVQFTSPVTATAIKVTVGGAPAAGKCMCIVRFTKPLG